MRQHTTALLFPGQGSQTDTMRETVERFRPELLDVAEREVGDDPFERADDGTRFAQPAIYCASLAGFERLGRPGADCMAGHSLGEFAALVAAGSLSAEEGLRLVALRGRLMQDAAEATGDGGMLALRGSAEQAAPIAERTGLTIANDNAPEQVVLSGPADGLEQGEEEAQAGGLRATRLPVTGAFHSPAMAGAVTEFEAALADASFREPEVTVVSCVTAAPFDDIPRRLAEGLISPVRWRETLLHLHSLGVRRFLEVGPGKVLTGLVKRTLDDVEAQAGPELEPAHA